MDLNAKERQGRGLDALARGLRPYVESKMAAAIPTANWGAAYEAKGSARRGRPFRASLSDPRLLLQMVRFERLAFTDVDASQRAWLEELIQSANRAAHTTSLTHREADRALDTMLLLAESLGLDLAIQDLIALRLSVGATEVTEARAPGAANEAAEPAGGSASTQLQISQGVPADDVVDLEELPTGVRAVTLSVHGALVTVIYQEAVNLALTHNGVSAIRRVTVQNRANEPTQPLELTIAIDLLAVAPEVPTGVPLTLRVGPVETDEEWEARSSDLGMLVNPAIFLALDECATSRLRVSASTEAGRVEASGSVRLLTADEWWARGIPELLAAFVRPNDPALITVTRAASDILDRRTGSTSLEGYQAGPLRAQQIADALFTAISDLHLRYVEPPASFEGTGQRIRSHGQVLSDGAGTCIDLACLYAAVLENVGLHPVLAVFEGHAFAGYLTEDEQLPSVVVIDQGTALTIADSDFFDSVELTSVCGETATGFAYARQLTARWWSTDIAQLRFLLDVSAAHRRVKPLPTVRDVGGERVIEVVVGQGLVQRSAPRSADRRRPATTPTDKPGRVLRWERALLDMTYANPLLKQKASSSIGLHIPAGSLGAFEDQVARGETLTLVAHDEIEAIHRAQGARSAAQIEPESLRVILEQERRLFVAVAEIDYLRRLRALARRSKTAIEETGSDNLYLTLGTLRWSEGARTGAAPLFLVPIKLLGGRGVRGFSISYDESRERVPNYCLIEKLKTSFDLHVPELENPDIDTSGIDVGGALAALRTAILQTKNTVGFHVDEVAHLALLQFSTLEIWQDLRTNWKTFLQRPAIDHLVANPGAAFVDHADTPAPQPTDETETFLPIPADGSQIEAVRWAAAGKTFILEGPPGTGKSQTITNLIAHSIASGKRVLFVAEKAAALDVVRRRLDGIGIGTFCLDLHGRTQTVSAVRDQLRRALEERSDTDPGWEPLRSSRSSLAARLADYPGRLHQPGPAELSAWDARQLVLEQVALGADEASAVVVPRTAVLGIVTLADLYDDARALSDALTDLGGRPADSPWRLSAVSGAERLDREAVAAAVDALRQSVGSLVEMDGLGPLVSNLVESEQFDALVDWLQSLSRVRWTPSAALSVVSDPWRREVTTRREAMADLLRTVDVRLGPFLPQALDLDTSTLLARTTEIDGKFFGKKKGRRLLLAELQPVLRGNLPLPAITAALQELDALRRAHADVSHHVRLLPGPSLSQDWDPLRSHDVAWLEDNVASLEAAAAWGRIAAQLLPVASRAAQEAADRMVDHPRPLDLARVVRAYGASWRELRRRLAVTPQTVRSWRGEHTLLDAVRAALPEWSADAAGSSLLGLQRWLVVRSGLERFHELKIDDLAGRCYSGNLKPYDLEPQFRLGVALSVLEERLAATGLDGFDHRAHERSVAQFAERSAEARRRMPPVLTAEVIRGRHFDPSSRMGQVAELRNELSRRRGGRSVRQLMHDFQTLISEIAPCLMMSPQSVARFLPAATNIDLVVFDEASQIRVPESIGAMGRAAAAVIVGDSKQMPPTSVFAGTAEDPDAEYQNATALAPTDLESILSEAVESQFPRKLLSWHYRSRNEALIAFSNAHYYEGRLSSFPVAPRSVSGGPIVLRTVDGVWEGGSSGSARVNRREAAEIVAEIKRLLAANHDRTLGVVTFNSQQRDLVLDQLDADADPAVVAALQRETEPLFVKNLENVQGDERDVILFSLAFSPDVRGRVPLNWGPLTRTGGERRLNVAVTRAKERVIIVNSFEPRQLDVTNSSSQGLSDLKDYLMEASSGAVDATSSRRNSRDAHLDDVAKALQDVGLEARTNVGLSDFVVDIAVRRRPSNRWVAVLLDGPGWASRTSVGDRETLPRDVLTRMGWARVERVWLPSWLRSRTEVVDEIAGTADSLAADSIAAGAVVAEAGSCATTLARSVTSPQQTQPATSEAIPARIPPLRHGAAAVAPALPVYRPASEDACHGSFELDDSARARRLVREEAAKVIDSESPILVGRLIQVVARRFDLSRLREVRRDELLGYLDRGTARRSANGDLVAWDSAVDPATYTTFRVPRQDEKRDLQTVPYEEIRNAMIHLSRAAHGADRDDLFRETARLFGVLRLAATGRTRCESVLTAALAESRLSDVAGVIVVTV